MRNILEEDFGKTRIIRGSSKDPNDIIAVDIGLHGACIILDFIGLYQKNITTWKGSTNNIIYKYGDGENFSDLGLTAVNKPSVAQVKEKEHAKVHGQNPQGLKIAQGTNIEPATPVHGTVIKPAIHVGNENEVIKMPSMLNVQVQNTGKAKYQ